jgi:hypothetical protein
MLQRREEELGDFIGESRLVFHWIPVASMPTAPALGSRSRASRGTRPRTIP